MVGAFFIFGPFFALFFAFVLALGHGLIQNVAKSVRSLRIHEVLEGRMVLKVGKWILLLFM